MFHTSWNYIYARNEYAFVCLNILHFYFIFYYVIEKKYEFQIFAALAKRTTFTKLFHQLHGQEKDKPISYSVKNLQFKQHLVIKNDISFMILKINIKNKMILQIL